MTLALRSTFTLLSVILSLLLSILGIYIFAQLLYLHGLSFFEQLNLSSSWIWWFLTDESPVMPKQAFQTSISAIILSLIAFIALVLFRMYFRKTSSPEVFFFSLFLLTLSFNVLRILNLYIYSENYIINFIELNTRIILMSRISGCLFLLSASLYAADFKYQDYGILILLNIVLSFLISANIPINDMKISSNLLNTPGDLPYFVIFLLIIELLGILNLIVAFLIKNNQDYLYLAVNLLFVYLGIELVFQPLPILINVLGYVLLIIGTIRFGIRFHRIYLWI
ncbi:hypothetical protein [Spirochaeta cellobiosiphila]|uniref:hypothetical protein n=1 Tax=Spirochaeta cellobiosiphila TaxID=504483 RepID=UPI0003F81401|nr:hypothetical protein [Spirochaeta cellobiosiphila]